MVKASIFETGLINIQFKTEDSNKAYFEYTFGL